MPETVPGKKTKTPSGLLVHQKPPRQKTEFTVTNPEALENFRANLYNRNPDFGNMGLSEKADAVAKTLELNDIPINGFPEEIRDDFINKTLKELGEEDTYGVGEFMWDMGVPGAASYVGTVGGTALAGGNPIGGIIGAMLAGGLGAGVAEVAKSWRERSTRNIPPPSIDEMIDTGKWPAILETVTGIAPPITQLATLKSAKKLMLPGKELASDVTDAARITGKYKPPVEGKYGATRLVKRVAKTIRWGPGGERAALGVEQLNAHQEGVIANLADLLASSWFGGPRFKKQAANRVRAVQQELKSVFSQHMNYQDAHKLGVLTNEMLEEGIADARAWKTMKWAQASQSIEGKGYQVAMPRLRGYLDELADKPGLVDEAQQLRSIVERYFKKQHSAGFLSEDLGGGIIPNVTDATVVDALWHELNGIQGDLGKFAGHAAREARDDLMNYLKVADKEAHELFQGASEFHQYFKAVHEGDVMDGILKGIAKDARKLEGFVLSGDNKLGNLQAIKQVVQPKQFNREILPSLRWRYVDKAQAADPQFGKVFSGSTLINELKKDGLAFAEDGKTVLKNEYLEEMFNGPKQLQAWVDFARAADVAQSGVAGNKIIMKIFEASQMVGAARATGIKEMGTATGFLISPVALSYVVFANPRFLRELTDGLIGFRPIQDLAATAIRLELQSERATKEMTAKIDNFFKPTEPQLPQGMPTAGP